MFGKNEVSGPRPATDGLLVNSIFYTIQGEGPWAGMPTIFVRLSKCNLRCHFCISPGSRILDATGSYVYVSNLSIGDMVMGYKDDAFVPSRVKAVSERWTGTADIYNLQMNKGRHGWVAPIHVTHDHSFLTAKGLRYKEASELAPGDKLKVMTDEDYASLFPKRKNEKFKPLFPQSDIASVAPLWGIIAPPIIPWIWVAKNFTNKETGKKYQKVKVFDITTSTGNFVLEGVVAHNCDTEFETGTSYSVDELATELAYLSSKHMCGRIVITGGEPMLQHALSRLVLHRKLMAMKFQIETAGTVWPIGFGDAMMHGHITLVCSPKTAKVHASVEKMAAAWKYIIRHGETDNRDGLPSKSTQIAGQNQLLFRPDRARGQEIYVQPCDEGDPEKNKLNTVAATESALTHGYRVSIQMHKIIGVD